MFFLNRRFYGFVVSALLLLATDLSAKEALSSMLTVELGRNSADTDETYVDLDLGFNNGMHLRGMLGKTQQTVDGQVQESDSRLLGVSSDYSARFVAGFDYEYWGDKTMLETWTNRFKLGTNTKDWYLQFRYEDRRSQFPTSGAAYVRPNGKVVQLPVVSNVNSTGKGLNVSFYGLYPMALTLSYIRYSYDLDVAVLGKGPRRTQLVSSSNLDMPVGLETWRRSADMSYNLNWGLVGLSGSQGESVVDKSIARNISAYLIWNMRDDWSLTLTGGQASTDDSPETIRYGRVAVSHRW